MLSPSGRRQIDSIRAQSGNDTWAYFDQPRTFTIDVAEKLLQKLHWSREPVITSEEGSVVQIGWPFLGKTQSLYIRIGPEDAAVHWFSCDEKNSINYYFKEPYDSNVFAEDLREMIQPSLNTPSPPF